MSTRLSAADMARAHLTQAELDEYDAYNDDHRDLLNLTENDERNTMPAKYAIDQNYKQFR